MTVDKVDKFDSAVDNLRGLARVVERAFSQVSGVGVDKVDKVDKFLLLVREEVGRGSRGRNLAAVGKVVNLVNLSTSPWGPMERAGGHGDLVDKFQILVLGPDSRRPDPKLGRGRGPRGGPRPGADANSGKVRAAIGVEVGRREKSRERTR